MFDVLPELEFSEPEIERFIHRGDAFILQYPALIRLGQRVESEADLTGLALAVYGWMPTILRSFDASIFSGVAFRTFNTASARKFLEDLPLRAPVNNSWVGTSKFLHALNPDLFPIWDSHIARAFGLSKRKTYERRDAYIKYFDFCHAKLESKNTAFEQTAARINIQFDYIPTALRCLEFLIFSRSKLAKSEVL